MVSMQKKVSVVWFHKQKNKWNNKQVRKSGFTVAHDTWMRGTNTGVELDWAVDNKNR